MTKTSQHVKAARPKEHCVTTSDGWRQKLLMFFVNSKVNSRHSSFNELLKGKRFQRYSSCEQ